MRFVCCTLGYIVVKRWRLLCIKSCPRQPLMLNVYWIPEKPCEAENERQVAQRENPIRQKPDTIDAKSKEILFFPKIWPVNWKPRWQKKNCINIAFVRMPRSLLAADRNTIYNLLSTQEQQRYIEPWMLVWICSINGVRSSDFFFWSSLIERSQHDDMSLVWCYRQQWWLKERVFRWISKRSQQRTTHPYYLFNLWMNNVIASGVKSSLY